MRLRLYLLSNRFPLCFIVWIYFSSHALHRTGPSHISLFNLLYNAMWRSFLMWVSLLPSPLSFQALGVPVKARPSGTKMVNIVGLWVWQVELNVLTYVLFTSAGSWRRKTYSVLNVKHWCFMCKLFTFLFNLESLLNRAPLSRITCLNPSFPFVCNWSNIILCYERPHIFGYW